MALESSPVTTIFFHAAALASGVGRAAVAKAAVRFTLVGPRYGYPDGIIQFGSSLFHPLIQLQRLPWLVPDGSHGKTLGVKCVGQD